MLLYFGVVNNLWYVLMSFYFLDLLNDVNSKAPEGLQRGFHGCYQWGNIKSFDVRVITASCTSTAFSFGLSPASSLIINHKMFIMTEERNILLGPTQESKNMQPFF